VVRNQNKKITSLLFWILNLLVVILASDGTNILAKTAVAENKKSKNGYQPNPNTA